MYLCRLSSYYLRHLTSCTYWRCLTLCFLLYGFTTPRQTFQHGKISSMHVSTLLLEIIHVNLDLGQLNFLSAPRIF